MYTDDEQTLCECVKEGNLEGVQNLIEQIDGVQELVNCERLLFDLAIYSACGHCPDVLGIMTLLFKKGIDVNIQNNEGDTPLIIAAKRVNLPMLQLLINQENIDVNIKNNSHATALSHLVTLFDSASVKLLVEAKANVNTTHNEGNTLLHIMLEHHLDRYRVVNDNMGYCIARVLVGNIQEKEHDMCDVIRHLVRGGITINAQNQAGDSVLDKVLNQQFIYGIGTLYASKILIIIYATLHRECDLSAVKANEKIVKLLRNSKEETRNKIADYIVEHQEGCVEFVKKEFVTTDEQSADVVREAVVITLFWVNTCIALKNREEVGSSVGIR